MPINSKGLPAQTYPVINVSTGMMRSTWYQFFVEFAANALSVSGSNGLVVVTSSGFVARVLATGSSKISITNANGVSGNPTIDVNQGNLSIGTTQLTGTLAAAQFPALTGDITTSAGALTTTLATVNATVGSFTVSSITVNAKGLVTAAANGPTLASGVYTPTLTNTTNIDSSALVNADFNYMRVGSTVTVSGLITIDATATGNTVLGISLPVASNFGSSGQCAGTISSSSVVSECGAISGDAGNDRATATFVATTAASQTYGVHFTYQVI